MFLLRRAAVRSFAASPAQARTIVTKTPSGLRQSQKWQVPVFQRRFATDEASPAQEKTNDETDAVTTEAQAEQVPDVTEKSVSAAAEQPSMVEQVKEKVQDVKSNVTSAAEALLGQSARDAALGTHNDPKPSRILYVGNLFFEVKAQDLEREFSKLGRVVNARVAEDARGLSRGFGFVEYENIQDAEKAKNELDQKALAGRNMAVQYHVRREPRKMMDSKVRQNQPSKTLFVGNMSFQMSDKDLNDLFRPITNVLDVRVAVDRRSGQPRGFCHADFIDIPSAEKAKEILETKEIYGRQLRVDFSRAAPGGPRE